MLPTPTPTTEVLSIIPSVSQIPIWFTEGAKWITVIAGVITAVYGVIKLIAKPLKSIDQKIDTVDAKVAAVDKKVDVVQDDVADIQCHLLNQAHDAHMETGWCNRDEKDRLTEMCTKYTTRGRNHLRERYIDTLVKLPEKPPAKQTVKTKVSTKRTVKKKAPSSGAGQVASI